MLSQQQLEKWLLTSIVLQFIPFLKLPVLPTAHKDLSGQSLVVLQESLVDIEYIVIDECSMLGQNTIGWGG